MKIYRIGIEYPEENTIEQIYPFWETKYYTALTTLKEEVLEKLLYSQSQREGFPRVITIEINPTYLIMDKNATIVYDWTVDEDDTTLYEKWKNDKRSIALFRFEPEHTFIKTGRISR